jgi:hypothetical protein
MKELVKPTVWDILYENIDAYSETSCSGTFTCDKNCGGMCRRDISDSNRSILSEDEDIIF